MRVVYRLAEDSEGSHPVVFRIEWHLAKSPSTQAEAL
jgi:hypothetical protein